MGWRLRVGWGGRGAHLGAAYRRRIACVSLCARARPAAECQPRAKTRLCLCSLLLRRASVYAGVVICLVPFLSVLTFACPPSSHAVSGVGGGGLFGARFVFVMWSFWGRCVLVADVRWAVVRSRVFSRLLCFPRFFLTFGYPVR